MGRVCNVPTIWSNCLAGWWLGGGGRWFELGLLCVWVTLLYIGGMFLNDAFDANFDREHRRLRPIPSGAIGEKEEEKETPEKQEEGPAGVGPPPGKGPEGLEKEPPEGTSPDERQKQV